METQQNRILYLESTILRIITLLQEKEILDQDFVFLTEDERRKATERFVDELINS